MVKKKYDTALLAEDERLEKFNRITEEAYENFCRNVLYYYDRMFGHASQPKKSLTRNVFLLNLRISFEFFLIKNFQIDEHPVAIVQYCFSQTFSLLDFGQIPLVNEHTAATNFVLNLMRLHQQKYRSPLEGVHLNIVLRDDRVVASNRSSLSHPAITGRLDDNIGGGKQPCKQGN